MAVEPPVDPGPVALVPVRFAPMFELGVPGAVADPVVVEPDMELLILGWPVALSMQCVSPDIGPESVRSGCVPLGVGLLLDWPDAAAMLPPTNAAASKRVLSVMP